MKSQMSFAVKFCILISFLIFGACAHKPDTFSMNISHNGENVYLKHSVISRGAALYKMGPPQYSHLGYHQTFNFIFEVDDISSMYHAYLSIETWDVEAAAFWHPILLNNKLIGYLDRSIDYNAGRADSGAPTELGATQIYIPKQIIKEGKNILTIKYT